MNKFKFDKQVILLAHGGGTDEDSEGTYANYHLSLGKPYVINERINENYREEYFNHLDGLVDYLDHFEDYLEEQPMASIEVSTLLDNGTEDLPDFLQNPYGRPIVCLSTFVRTYEGIRLDFDADELGIWILSKFSNDFSHYDIIKDLNTESGARVEAFMNKQIKGYLGQQAR
jgi:hypothetical protein